MEKSKSLLTQNLQEYFINDVTLKKLQSTIFEIFVDVYEACIKHSIPIYLMHGTLLGAVRHKGFIPWDDDIDVVAYANDIKKIIEVVNLEYPNKYEFAGLFYDYKVNPFFALKIMKKGTTLVEFNSENYPGPKGIFIDIFPIFNIPVNNKKRKLLEKKLDILIHVGTFAFEYKYKPETLFNINKKIKKYYKKRRMIGFFCLPFYNISRKLLLKYYYNSKNTGYYAINTVIGFKDDYPINSKLLNEVSLYEFCGKKFKSIKNFDYILKAQYGNDYMTLPPIEKRERHLCLKLNFDIEE